MKTLLIVESPAKAKTIEKLLGDGYIVRSSFGHIRDLEKENFGVDIENGFKPNYKICDGKGKVIKELLSAAKTVDRILLASDEDREGEAISWHIAVMLKLNIKENNRISFHEITKKALENAVSNPRKVDMDMVHSQQTRQILDKIIGFSLSPLLWSYIAPKLSAGRVQSVCLKLVVEKEADIAKFNDKKYYKTKGTFDNGLEGFLNHNFETNEELVHFLNDAKKSTFKIHEIEKSKTEKNPPPAFITSSIQQEAGSKFGISSKRIMSILQKIYEAGLITYHRTDNVNLSNQFIESINEYVNDKYGSTYFKKRIYKSKVKCAQEAHEAIRPTNLSKVILDSSFDTFENKVYQLIWKRAVASQMSQAIYDSYKIIIEISKSKYVFECKFEKLVFEGYKKVYDEYVPKKDADETPKVMKDDILLSKIKKDDIIKYTKIVGNEKYQQPPLRYSESTLIKKMEKLGIGRPSTYANIIETIQQRNYAKSMNIDGIKKDVMNYELVDDKIKEIPDKFAIGSEKRKLLPTDIGKNTSTFLNDNFEDLMNYSFTSKLEESLDDVANNKINWTKVLTTFYSSFEPKVKLLKSSASKKEAFQKKEDSKKNLGINDKNEHVFAYVGKYGPVLQFVDVENDKKVRFQKLEDFDVNKVTLEDIQSVKGFDYPKDLGVHENKNIFVKKGKFGFYLDYDKKNYKILGDYDEDLTLRQAIECLVEKKNNDIHKFGDYIVKNGQYGPYVLYKSKFYTIPSNYDLDKLTKEDCVNIIKNPYLKSNDKTKKNSNDKTKKNSNDIHNFGDYIVKNGQYGPYILYNSKFYKIKKDQNVQKLTKEDCIKIVNEK